MTHVVGKQASSSQRLKQLCPYASSPGHSELAVAREEKENRLIGPYKTLAK